MGNTDQAETQASGSHVYSLDKMVADAQNQFGESDPGKVAQLEAHVASVKMVLDQLHERAATSGSDEGE